MRTHRSDILIIGAGPAAAHLACLLGKVGFSINILDKSSPGDTGASWVNGVPTWMFEAAGMQKPLADEVHTAGSKFTIIDPTHQARLSISASFLLDINMRVFGDRLLSEAQNLSQVHVFHQSFVKGFEFDSQGKPQSALTLHDRFQADLMVDASGLAGVLRKSSPFLKELCPGVEPKDLCRAAQEVREITDPHGALSFLETHRGETGEILSWIGVSGGYSLLRVQISPDLKTITFLTGTRALFGVPSGAKLIQNFVAKHAWIGSRVFGGQRAIPIRYPYPHLVSPGIALLGDSGCQVYSAHGSGIGIGLLAAKELADAVKQAADQGMNIGSLSALWPYAHRFHERYAGLLLSSDLMRRFAQRLSPYEVHQFVSSGLMTEELLKSSLLQQHPEISWQDVSKQIGRLFRAPALLTQLVNLFTKFPRALWTARRYPESPNLEQVLSYERKINWYLQ